MAKSVILSCELSQCQHVMEVDPVTHAQCPQEFMMIVSNQAKSFATFLQKAQQLNLSPIAYSVMQPSGRLGWTKTQTVKAIARYLAFLYLADCYPTLQLVPSSEIDQVWHAHILDTRKYTEDCQMLFGQMIHHYPYLGQGKEKDQYNQMKAYVLTQVLLKRHFSISLEDTSSGDCEPIQLQNNLDWRAAGWRSQPPIVIATEEVLLKMC